MTEPQITVRKYGAVVPVTIVGKDDQGRLLVRCPSRGCGETAAVMEDGEVVCPVGQAEVEFLRAVYEQLTRADAPK